MDAGDIVQRKNIIFPDTGKLDIKIKGHPTLEICHNKGYTYYLIITSTIWDNKDSQFIKLYPNKMNGLVKDSYLNIKHVFKTKSRSSFYRGYISDTMLSKIILSQYKLHFDRYRKDNKFMIDNYREIVSKLIRIYDIRYLDEYPIQVVDGISILDNLSLEEKNRIYTRIKPSFVNVNR